ncbi:MAG: hypothetical protein D6807_07540 [Alphaproteobacteria bacterium]|nr:MAG: hypothetical protein D6807_07540 [Alphaproteobacteria bacterium]
MTLRHTARALALLTLAIVSINAAAARAGMPLPTLKAGLRAMPLELPAMVDEETRLDRVEGGVDEVLYFYTLVNYEYAMFADPRALLDNIAPNIRENYCQSDDMAGFRENNIAMLHIYYDKDGELIGTIKTNLTHCAKDAD